MLTWGSHKGWPVLKQHSDMGAPPGTPAAAFRVLCGATPGYFTEPERPASAAAVSACCCFLTKEGLSLFSTPGYFTEPVQPVITREGLSLFLHLGLGATLPLCLLLILRLSSSTALRHVHETEMNETFLVTRLTLWK